MQSINGNRRKGTNMDNEMIEKSSENCSESSCCCGTRHKKRTEAEQKALLTVDELCELLQRLMK